MLRHLILLALLLFIPRHSLSQDAGKVAASVAKLHRIVPNTPQELHSLFEPTGSPLPFLSAHRGGPQQGFPENCLATFENTLGHTFAILEIDPRYTKDGQIVVLHDPTLDRTTTGKGRLTDHTLAELKELRLKDPQGNVTEHTIPTLDEALEWARGKTVLVLDQKDVPVPARVKKIEEHKAEAYAMLIVYSFAEAQACHALNPNIFMEVMIPSHAKIAEFSKLGVPWRNVVAFVGHIPPEDKSLYEAIHAKGTSCMIGTSRNLDRQLLIGQISDIRRLESDYRAFFSRGADIIETDIPTHLGPLLLRSTSPASPRSKLLRVE